MRIHKRTTIEHFFPLCESGANAIIGILDFTSGQIVVDFIAIGTQVQVIEYACRSPQVLGANGKRGNSSLCHLVAVAKQFFPGRRLAQFELVVDVFAVVDAPLVIGIRHAPLLVIASHGWLDCVKFL